MKTQKINTRCTFKSTIFSIFLIAIMVTFGSALFIFGASITIYADENDPDLSQEYKYGELFYYQLRESGLHITRGVKDQHYDANGNLKYEDKCMITDLTVPDAIVVEGKSYPVEFIDGPCNSNGNEGPFENCTNLKSLKLPKHLKTIGDDAFKSCDSLTEVILPEGLELLGCASFSSCTSLTSVYIPSSVHCYDFAGQFSSRGPFVGDRSLTNVEFGEGVEAISAGLFDSTGLTHLTIPDSVKEIGPYAFYGTNNLISISFSDKSELKAIGYSAFESSGIKEIGLPDSLTEIGEYAFCACNNLKKIVIPGNVDASDAVFPYCDAIEEIEFTEGTNRIGERLFSASSIKSITIPASVETIDWKAFSECTELEKVIFESGSNLKYISISAFEDNTNLTDIILPKNLRSIGTNAFNGCSSLKEMYFNGPRPEVSSSICNGVTADVYFHLWDKIPTNWGGNLTFKGKVGTAITEDQLFGEYSKYLLNKTYKKMENDLISTMFEMLAMRTIGDDNISALKHNMQNPTKALTAMIEVRLGENWSEEKTRKAVALELVNQIADDKDATTKTIKTMKKWVDGVNKGYDIGSKLKKTMDAKALEEFAESLPESTTKLSKKEVKEMFKVIQWYAYKEKQFERVDGVFKVVDNGLTVAETCAAALYMAQLDLTLIDQLKQEIPQGSELYMGLCDLEKDVRMIPYMAGRDLVHKYVNEGFVKYAQKKGIQSIATLFASGADVYDGSPSLEYALVKLGYYVLGWAMPGMSLEKVDKAWISLDYAMNYRSAIEGEKVKIINNYKNNEGLDIKELKAEYGELYSHYISSIDLTYEKVSTAYEGSIIDKWTKRYEAKAKKLKSIYKKHKKKLTFKKYIKSCLANANADWEYELVGGKYHLVKYYEQNILPQSKNTKSLLKKEDNSYDENEDGYCLDIPSEIDGHTIEEVSSDIFADAPNVTGVYVPETVSTIGYAAFRNCNNLDTVYLSSGLQKIDDDAFSGCTLLTEIFVPGTVKMIGENAFGGIDNMTLEGENEVVSAAAEQYPSITYEEEPKEISDAEIASYPSKTEYEWDEAIDPSGLTINATYADGTQEMITEGFVCYYDDKKPGINTVNVFYNEILLTYEVTVHEKKAGYTINYVNELGDVIQEPLTAEAVIGEHLTVDVPDIEGYISPESPTIMIEDGENEVTLRYSSEKKSIMNANVTYKKTRYYTGNKIVQSPTVRYDGQQLIKGEDYTIQYLDNVRCGSAMMVISGIGEYDGITACYFNIVKRNQPMTVKATKKTVKYKIIKRRAVTVAPITVKNNQGKVSYKLVSGTAKSKKALKLNTKTGKVKVTKKTKKGLYRIKVKVTAAGNAKYKAGSKIVTVSVRIK